MSRCLLLSGTGFDRGVEQLETYFGKYLPAVVLQPDRTTDLISHSLQSECKGKCDPVDLCTADSDFYCEWYRRLQKKLFEQILGIYTGLGDSFLENLQGLTTLKIYQADQQKADEMDVESQNFRRITMKVLTMQLNSTSVMDIVAYGGAAIGMAVAVSEFLKGNISVAGTLCIVLLASEFFLPLRLLGSFFHIAMNGMAASDKIFKIFRFTRTTGWRKNTARRSVRCYIKRCAFSYEEDREILKGINLNLGRKFCITGW